MANPHLEECPDYGQPEFDEAQLFFTVDGKTDEEAAILLQNMWHFNNNKAIAEWDRQRIREEFEVEEERRRVLREAEEEQAKQEERKKYKNKFAPIPDRPLPAAPFLLPSQYMLNKLRKGEYVPLYAFTNKGMREAEEDTSDDEDLLTLVQTDKGPTFQTAAAAKAKKHKIKDERLSWEEFSQANFRMLNCMKLEDWLQERVAMVRDFWVALETHDWHHDTSETRKQALLLYQGRVHRDWHKTLGTLDVFRLLPLCMDWLHEYHQELLDNAYAAKIEVLPTVCHFHTQYVVFSAHCFVLFNSLQIYLSFLNFQLLYPSRLCTWVFTPIWPRPGCGFLTFGLVTPKPDFSSFHSARCHPTFSILLHHGFFCFHTVRCPPRCITDPPNGLYTISHFV